MNLLKNNLIVLAVLLLGCCTSTAQESGILAGGDWTEETVAEGIVLRRAAFADNLFGANQYLCVLEIAPGARFDIVPSVEKTLETTSALAARYDAIAAINGSFFNMRAPYGSVNYLRVDGAELAPNAPDSYENPRRGRSTRQTGAVATFRGDIYVLIVADGRNKQAAGLSMNELLQVMQALGCADAVNLDGGGSTTMVVRGQVVNHPSDNKEFDAAGERPVANAIIVRQPTP